MMRQYGNQYRSSADGAAGDNRGFLYLNTDWNLLDSGK